MPYSSNALLAGRSGAASVNRRRTPAQASGPVHTGAAAVHQLFIGSSDPTPMGVFIVVQVPFGTYFHALA